MKEMLATIILGDQRKIVLELYPKIAPQTVINFIRLSNNGFFNKMSFCRVVNERLIQIGDTNLAGEHWTDASPGYILEGEFNKDGFTNELSFDRGVVGMAMGDYEWSPNASAGSFFIMSKSEPELDTKVTAFARVIDGMDVVDSINKLSTYEKYGIDIPDTLIYIENIILNETSKELIGQEIDEYEDIYYEKIYGKKTQRIERFD